MQERTTVEYWDKRAKENDNDMALVYEDVVAFENSSKMGNALMNMFPGTILDIGCGYGRFYKPERKYTGVDFSKEMIKKAKKRFPDGDFRVGSWYDDLGTYDVVIEAICLSSFGGNMDEFKEVLLKFVNPNGILIMLEAKATYIFAKDNMFKYESRK